MFPSDLFDVLTDTRITRTRSESIHPLMPVDALARWIGRLWSRSRSRISSQWILECTQLLPTLSQPFLRLRSPLLPRTILPTSSLWTLILDLLFTCSNYNFGFYMPGCRLEVLRERNHQIFLICL